jgi:hypothetical protein
VLASDSPPAGSPIAPKTTQKSAIYGLKMNSGNLRQHTGRKPAPAREIINETRGSAPPG